MKTNMQKIVFFLTAFLALNFCYGQEMLSPLMYNQNIKKESQASRNINNLFIYAKDTIHLPFKDDFSKDFFIKYNAKTTDTNVTDTLHYAIYIAGNPDVDTAAYMDDTTYQYNITIYPGDSLGYDTIPQASINITYCDLSSYPVVCQSKTVWPATTIIDSLHTGISPDGVYAISPADFVQDSATVYFVDVVDSTTLWEDNHVFLNSNYQVNPPTIGVATFDGLNKDGYPYDFSSAFSYGIADYLTSKPINLKQDELGNPYGLSDSLYLSFYYQPQGLGNEPEVEDSLVLQFWAPGDSAWHSMWRVGGSILDTNFKRVMIPIKQNKFLDDGFQFRFLNYASLSGSFDHWNLDYVYLDANRFAGDTNLQDAAFVYPVNSLLKNYTAMPWKHYKWDVNGFTRDSIITQQKNLDNVGHLMGSFNLEVSYQNTLLTTINNPNTPSVSAFTPFETEFKINNTNNFYFDTTVNDTCAVFDISIRHNTTPDLCRNNDTIYLQQEFTDYYAYDDGSAEAAYGVQGVGGILPKIASKFNLMQGDTIKSLKIHFSPSAYDRSSTPVIMTIWKEGSGGKPGTILHENIAFSSPVYNIGLNGFYEYKFDTNVYVPAGNYFVGWQQTTSDIINVGYDLNIDNDPSTFYNSTGNWTQSGFGGTLMIRPAFVFDKDYLVSIAEEEQKPSITLYPNPTNDFIYINNASQNLQYQIFDVNGKFISNGTYQDGISFVDYETGFYLIHLTDGKFHYHKKIIKN